MPKAAKVDPKKAGKGKAGDKPKNSSGSKPKKKKWSKGKTKEKLNNDVLINQATWDRIEKDIAAKSKMITPSIIADRCKINMSCARRAIKELETKGSIKLVGDRCGMYSIFTSASKA